MKRYICLIISLCLILGSFSFVFATATSWDTSDQANLSNAASRLYYNGYSAAYYLKQIADRTAAISTISSDLSTIKGYLFDDGHSIAYWTSAISSWMSPIYNSLTQTPVDLATIIGALGYYDSNNTYHPYLNAIANGFPLTSNIYGINSSNSSLTTFTSNNLAQLLNNYLSRDYMALHATSGGTIGELTYYDPTTGNPINYNYRSTDDLFRILLSKTNQSLASFSAGYPTQQTATNWGSLGTAYFTPTSSINGIYSWFSAIQTPVARLSYVMASDERIAAQQAAAAAEQQVVDDFIDPAGDSSATASDFGSISDLSSGYQQNFGSTASVSGIFDIFDSNNFGWFSSETYQQLDTTVATRGSSFETPLLNKQLEDISRALGVDYAN